MASTYVNNLRLEEMATGEQSGTWGTKTNTNLELIGQAVAWGTRAIANASTDNITIADGAADADRCLGLKLTGGGQACTVTLLPNTSSKTWVMYNATSYTLTFTCGSGANVAILAGETKMIATDGLGSGGVVHDLLTSVNLAGTTKTAALTNAGALSNQGTVTVGVDDTGYDVTFFGATSGAHMLWDESADDLKLVGAAGLTVAGDIDVDGTTNLDAVDIDGAVQIDATLNVGVDDTGYDVKFFGATSGSYMLWDESTDDLILGGAAKLGIGTTPNSGAHTSWANLSMGTKGNLISSTAAGGLYGMLVTDNLYIAAATGSLTYRTTNEASYYYQEAGVHRWLNAPSGTAGATATMTERMRITAAGNVGIGTSAPGADLTISTAAASGGAFTTGLISAVNTNTGGSQGPIAYFQSSSNSGYGVVTIKAVGARNTDAALLYVNTDQTATITHIMITNGNGAIGSISSNGTTTAFNTSSDYRLKENVNYDWDATTRLKQLKPARFNFIAGADTTVDGFLAHEAATVVPEAVTGTKDEVKVWTSDEVDNNEAPDGVSAGDNKLDDSGNTIPVMQGIDQAKLVPLLVKTILELEARITALEG